MPVPKHVSWFKRRPILKTADGRRVRVVELRHKPSEDILSAWASHLREHYCPCAELDEARRPTGLSRSDYLRRIKVPNKLSTVSGDFAEILLADYCQYVLDYIVPRTRYDRRVNRNSSTLGIDILAFKLESVRKPRRKDKLLTCEVKAALSARSMTTFERALKDSQKDFEVRKAESLNAVKQRLKDRGDVCLVEVVERFQNQTDLPYTEVTGAACVHSYSTWDDSVVTSVSSKGHPNSRLRLWAVKGNELMTLARELYRRVCDDA